MSHPSRVRGLKRLDNRINVLRKASHPSRVRGLKLKHQLEKAYYMVAPLAGAWIETWNYISSVGGTQVAPLAGAWIETSNSIAYL